MVRKIFKPFEIVIASLLGIFISMIITAFIVRSNVSWSEGWTTSVSRGYISFMNVISGVFPFSLFEVGLVLLIAAIITLLVLMIISFVKHHKRRGFRELAVIITLVVAVAASYSFIVVPMYNRAPMEVPQYSEKVEQSEYWNIVSYYKDDFNECSKQLSYNENGDVVSPYTVQELGEKLNVTYNSLNDPYIASGNPRVKPMFLSFLYRELHITGVSFAISGEANVNYLSDASSLPFIAAHELAHQKGIMNEDDANLYALYVCLNSDDPYIRYSGYFNGIYSMLNLLDYTGFQGDYSKMYFSFSEEIRNNFVYCNEYWASHDLLGSIGKFFNDIYLKINGGSTGDYVDTYETEPTDSGTTGEQGEIIYNITYTPYQKLYFANYYEKVYSK